MALNTSNLNITSSLLELKGIGPARSKAFASRQLYSIKDLLYFFPRRYEDRRQILFPKDLQNLPENTHITVLAKIHSSKSFSNKGKNFFELKALGKNGDSITCMWFHTYPNMKARFPNENWGIFTGVLKKVRHTTQLIHPDVTTFSTEQAAIAAIRGSLHWGRIVPLYLRIEGISQKQLREILYQILTTVPLNDPLPENIREKLKLLDLSTSLYEIHFPQEKAEQAKNRLIFDELLHLQLQILQGQSDLHNKQGLQFIVKNHLEAKIRSGLPFTLTSDQENALTEIQKDLEKPFAMNRILQGDVGSGKTIVAFLSIAKAIENQYQAALLVPTEVLAKQHFATAQKIFANTNISIGLLTSSLTKNEKNTAYEKIQTGDWQCVIGTHALLQDALHWKALGLVIIDEQHRFGVEQRKILLTKSLHGYFPHLLTMTATPIPRTLALTIFGELPISTIEKSPPGRQTIITKIIPGSARHRLYNLICKEAAAQRQSYIVYPVINESKDNLKSVEQEFLRLKTGPLAALRLAMIHGQMKEWEREQTMSDFKEKKYDVLISTTIIEVGIDIPNATVMAVEHAERFGLAQLHQLRGRVGRGKEQSYCVLVSDLSPPQKKQEQPSLFSDDGEQETHAWHRLAILEQTQDGFLVSEHDLKLRGPGEFIGIEQSGVPEFHLADLRRDQKILELARQTAKEIILEKQNTT